jgi:hypothetical protein
MTSKKLAPEVEALSDVLTALATLKTDEEKRWVLETAANRLGGNMAGQNDSGPKGRGGLQSKTLVLGAGETPKEFMRAKDPKSDVQRVACLAFYLTNYRETQEFKSTDLTALNTEAAGPRINTSRAVNNATNQNQYLAAAGRGRKQITSVGEDVVRALPNQEAVKAAELKGAKLRHRRRRGVGNTGKK